MVKLVIQRIFAHIHPSAFLLAAQLLLLVLYAAFDGRSSERALVNAFGIVVLMLVVAVISHSPAVNWVAWVLAVPAFVLSLLSAFFSDLHVDIWLALVNALLYFYGAGALIAYMMEDYQVTTDELFAAAATFTLLAWGFAYIYMLCQIWSPGSFVSSVAAEPSMSFLKLLFLSFTNLSSAGLSDIVPVSAPARVLVMLEQLIGVGYIAVVVSRLVGLTVQRREAGQA